jgi:O-methyltransferase
MSEQIKKAVEAARAMFAARERPQRYLNTYFRYLERGGLLRIEEDGAGYVNLTKGGDMSRFWTFCLAFDQIVKERIPGDFAELGVYKGKTATVLASFARRLGRKAYLLDTFDGFAEADLRGVDARQQVRFADTSLEAVRALVGEPNVSFIKGRFPETASQLPQQATFAFVHIDCDLYAPILGGLEYFYSRMAPGGFMFVHDYTSLAWDGAEKAVDDFFQDKSEAVIPLPDVSGSIVVRKAFAPLR